MAGQIVNLTTAKGGLNRMRVKGSPSPDSLYELTNAYVDASGAIQSRPGTVLDVTLPAGTKGLCAYSGKLWVFSHQTTATGDADYECAVLVHPTDNTQVIERIHFASPFLGYLYVVPEFANGDVYHYWLRDTDTWVAGTAYGLGDVVQPVTPNGYHYVATRNGAPGVKWAAGVERAVNDVVEATTFDGYQYTVTVAEGNPARSGTTEPTWNAEDGALTEESIDLTPPSTGSSGSNDPGTTLPPEIQSRYDNFGGSRPSIAR